ncbi:MAG: NAD kinase [Chlamydiia bacterium]|nr:NAD kinase [Chlamydiia bacterium]
MKKIAIIISPTREKARSIANQVHKYLSLKKGIALYYEKEIGLSGNLLTYENAQEMDLFIAIGGDGTVLYTGSEFGHAARPVCGINAGHLGFMSQINPSELESSLDRLISGDFIIENRAMLSTKLGDKPLERAINDVVIHRAQHRTLVQLKVFIDGALLNEYAADGLILSTSSGSTAYNLAAGGPIVYPNVPIFIITPICPHSLSNRPIVVHSSSTIEVEYTSSNGPIEVAIDGRHIHPLCSGQRVKINQSSQSFDMILMKNDFFEVTRSKLNWTGRSNPG